MRTNVRIVSDGTGAKTQCYFVAEDGTETRITNVSKAEWTCPTRGPAFATLTFIKPKLDVKVEGTLIEAEETFLESETLTEEEENGPVETDSE